jgi:hypothetical protein
MQEVSFSHRKYVDPVISVRFVVAALPSHIAMTLMYLKNGIPIVLSMIERTRCKGASHCAPTYQYIDAVKIIALLDLEQNRPFKYGH